MGHSSSNNNKSDDSGNHRPLSSKVKSFIILTDFLLFYVFIEFFKLVIHCVHQFWAQIIIKNEVMKSDEIWVKRV
jgi:hypothetical protein